MNASLEIAAYVQTKDRDHSFRKVAVVLDTFSGIEDSARVKGGLNGVLNVQ